MISPRKAIVERSKRIERLDVRVERLGRRCSSPNGDPTEEGGMLNPACSAHARARTAALSALRRCRKHFAGRDGSNAAKPAPASTWSASAFALQPEAPYELRPQPGYGCEDPRVTYVPVLEMRT